MITQYKSMKTSTKIWLVLTVISNIALLYFFQPIIQSIKYSNNSVTFNLTTEAYVGLALFVVANISGSVVMLRFLKTQPLNSQIFFSIVPITVTFVLVILFLFTINTTEQTDLVSAVRLGLNINTEQAKYIWIAVVAVVYVVYTSVICFIVVRPLKKVERAVGELSYGKTKKQIKIGGSKQFQNIEFDLNAINNNYKESSKIVKNINPIIIEEAIEKTSPTSIEKSNLIVSTQK